MMKKVMLDDSLFYAVGKLDNPIDNQKFTQKLYTMYYSYPQLIYRAKSGRYPHDQLYSTIVSTSEVRSIYDTLSSSLSVLVNREKDYVFDSWVLFANNSHNKNFYHTHPHIREIENQWSMCYYTQMPDNLTGDEGKILFKTKDNTVHKYLPQEGDLVIFPGSLHHTPVETTKSTKERVVFCSNFSFLELNNVKVKKSIL